MVAGYSTRDTLESVACAHEVIARHFLLLVGDAAVVHLKFDPRCALPHPLPTAGGLPLRVHLLGEHVHVRLRRRQVLHDRALWYLAIHAVHHRRAADDADQHRH